MKIRMKRSSYIVLVFAIEFLFSCNIGKTQTNISWWPEKGTIMLGGGHLSDSTANDFEKRFIVLAGGVNSVIIIIPTANPGFSQADLTELKVIFESRGAGRVVILNTTDRKVASSDSVAKLLHAATGVFLTGGQSMLLQKYYRGTLVQSELKALLLRGGVIAGDSAGAIAIGCIWLTWLPDPFGKRTDELCLLSNIAVTPHANNARGYNTDDEVIKYLDTNPTVVGIDVDEDTMLILDKQTAEVIGNGNVSILNAVINKTKPFLKLKGGDKYSLQK
jgi:cyanophycinase